MQYVHTNVCHEKKPGRNLQYTQQFEATLASGEQRSVMGRAEKVDGFWSSLRRMIGRCAANTGKSSAGAKRLWFRANVRVAQWHWWHLDANRFRLFGGYLSKSSYATDFF